MVRELSERTQVYPFRRNVVIPQEKEETKEYTMGQGFNPKFIIVGLLMFLMARVQLFGNLWVFAPAFLAAAVSMEERKYSLILLTACFLGLYIGDNPYFMLNGLSIFLLVFFVSVGRRIIVKYSWILPLLIFFIMVSVKSTYFLTNGFPNFYIAETIFEGFFAAGLSIAVVRGLEGINKLQKGSLFTKDISLGLIVFGIVVLVSLMDISLWNINLGRTIALIFILGTAFLYGGAYGASIGVVSGFAPALLNAVVSPYSSFLALSGLLAGVFRNLGKTGCVTGFVIGQLAMAYFLFHIQELNVMIIETILAGLLFFIIPTKLWQGIYEYIPEKANYKNVEQALLDKMREMTNIFRELSKTFRQVSDDIECKDKGRFDRILETISKRVCSGCSVFMICWQREKKATRQQMCTLFNLIEVQGKVNKEDLPGELKKRCVRPEELVTVAGCLYETHLLDKYYRNKLHETRNLVSQQLHGLSEIMETMAGDLNVDRDVMTQKEMHLLKKIEELGIGIIDLKLSVTSEQSLEIEIFKEVCKGKMECNLIIKPYIEEYLNEMLNVDRSSCAQKNGQFICTCKLRPATALKVYLGISQVKSEGTVVCGDTYKSFELAGGKHVIALSDGMGVGPKAAKESNTVLSLLEKLLTNGYDKELAIKTINSVLGIRSEDEVFATLDMVMLDIYSGRAEFVKIGAAPGFIKRGNQVGVITPNTHPLGILNGVEVTTQVKHLQKGDILIIVSDGVLEAGEFRDKEGWMVEVLKDLRIHEPQELSQMILRHSLAVAPDIINDDMTVLVVKLE